MGYVTRCRHVSRAEDVGCAVGCGVCADGELVLASYVESRVLIQLGMSPKVLPVGGGGLTYAGRLVELGISRADIGME